MENAHLKKIMHGFQNFCTQINSFYFFKKIKEVFACLKGRIDREREGVEGRELSSSGSLPKWPAATTLDQAEARSQELQISLVGGRDPGAWIVIRGFVRCISSELDWDSDTERGCLKAHLYGLPHSTHSF